MVVSQASFHVFIASKGRLFLVFLCARPRFDLVQMVEPGRGSTIKPEAKSHVQIIGVSLWRPLGETSKRKTNIASRESGLDYGGDGDPKGSPHFHEPQ